jgi:transcriptional regulator MraZ
MRFKGRYKVTLDAKGRMSIPAPMREQLAELGEETVVATCTDRCLELIPSKDWEEFLENFDSLPSMQEEVELFELIYISSAMDVLIDKAGRILVPQALRDQVGLEREIVVVGGRGKIRVYSQTAWQEVFELARRRFPESRNRISEEIE